MGVSTITILSLPDDVFYPDQISVRPVATIKWVGDVGPYDVLHEWDTVSTFDSGDLITDSNTGISHSTSADDGVPPSDMGAEDWFYRVTVTDTDDSGSLTTTFRTIQFFDDTDTAHHIWWLYSPANITPAFGSGEPDDPLPFERAFYQFANITTAQPCPFFDTMAPTLVNTGDAVLITGNSFGALQSTFDTEVRLYDDGPALSGPFVLLTPASWSDTEISATVPAGASTGWVTLVQTNGSETCPSSDFKILQIIQTPPDPDAGWFLLTSDKQNALTQDETILPGNISKTSFKKIMNTIGSGRIDLPLGDPQIDDFIDPVTRKGVLVRTYLDDRFRYAWFTEKLSHDYDEEGNAIAVISGRGMEVVAEWAKVKPHDFPASPTKSPTWVYGSTDNHVRNGTMGEGQPVLSNPGGEEGNDQDGVLKGWSARGKNLDSMVAVQSAIHARTGDWYMEFDASDNHSGITQSVTCTPGKYYHVRAFAMDVGATGMRVTLALGGDEAIAAIGTTYPNNFAFGGEILAELDNVARAPGGTGLPGGSTDGTWQQMDVEVLTGPEQTSLTITIQHDHHGGGAPFFPIRVEDVEIEGWGLGLDPWIAFAASEHDPTGFRVSTIATFDGNPFSLALDANTPSGFAGVEQLIQVTPLTKYTATIWANIFGAAGDDTYKLEIHKNDGPQTFIGTADEKVLDPGWNQFQVIFTTDSTTEELFFRFVYSGPNNPPPIYLASASLLPGEPPSTAGRILNDVLDKMALDNVLLYLGRSFTDTLDSKGAAWPAVLSLDIEPEESLAGLLGRLVSLGHEWEIVPVDFAEGGDSGFELNVYTARPFNSESGLGINFSLDPEGPVIHPGDATIGGRVIKTGFNTNRVMAIGDDGTWSRVNQDPWLDADQPPGDPAPHGYLDSFGPIEDVISVPAGDATTVSQFADSRLAEEKDKERHLQLEMQRSSVIRPFLTFNVGDSLFTDMPPYHPDPDREDAKRVRAITADLAGEGADINFSVDINRVVYEDELAWFAMIAQLNERAPAENTGVGTGRSSSGGGGSTTVIVGGGASAEVPLHTHDLKGTDIKNRALFGDVSGSLPGPITVNALKGTAIEGDIPADVAGDPVLMTYNRELTQWVPVETSLSVAASTKATTLLLGGM